MAGSFNIQVVSESAAVNLLRLEAKLQGMPEKNYVWAQFVSSAYGVQTEKVGTKVQVNRLKPFEQPTDANLSTYLVAQTRDSIATTENDVQKLSYDSVSIEVFRTAMPKP